ncbi:MAG: restriction endonuclease subunit S [Candidatus Nanopelagicales bacterium]|nr:restriction endonuclease subunit S [Candidatus Nanopelagicales bacterium]
MSRVAFRDLLAEPVRNGVYKPKDFHGTGVKLVNMKELFAYNFLSDQPESRIELTPAEFAKSHLRDGDLLFARRSFVLEGAGKCSLVVHPPEPLTFESSMIRARPNPEKASSRYLFYYFQSPAGRARMASIAARTAVSGITGSNLAALEIDVPTLEAQRQIAEVLGLFDELIENIRWRVRVLEEIARAIYQEWFVRFRYPGHESVPLISSARGPIPEGWTVDPFDAIASFVNGFAFKPSHWGSEGRPIIKIKELKQGVTAKTPRCPEGDIDRKFWVESGDLLMSWSADLGAYLWGDEPGLLNQHLFTVRPTSESVTLLYLLHALDNAMPAFRARAQGTTMKHIKRAALHEVSAVVPPLALVRRFDEVARPIDDESMSLQARERELTAMRDLLLPTLVTGQIDLSGLNLDGVVEEVVA